MRFSLSPSRPFSPSALLLTTTFLALFTSRASAGFDFKVTADRCPQLNIQLTTGVLDGSTSATAFNLTIAKLPDLNSRVVPAPFYSAQIGLDNSALFFNKATDKGYFFNYSLGSQYSNQDIRSVLINATLLDTNNQPLKNIFGKEYLKGAFLDPLCRTSGTGNVNPTISGIPGFVTPSQTSTSSDGSAGTGESADNKGPDTKLIVGLVVGLVGGLISIIIVGVVFWRKRQVRLGKRQETANPYAADHMGSNAREWKPVN
ncbi:unnamed protein product [Tilletia controversa]|uniref:Mid2 domain-containing protein n=1 Tax=Tilletia controversa TaxID=13291 RepID=A0A8X7MWH1_9BASI|nr:hypothetical protein CF328_g1021 [Tilletia controversa]CAD6896768.1 unnamed protein product [Tilletia laevis]KAE8251955.1 hypothetical protein A4X06_0g2471 [Tilletia controversa]CAD6926218.1 unnamed protein product [Tilletia controversa]CAD6946263.1 unnamed protein product [Tilletia controversa]